VASRAQVFTLVPRFMAWKLTTAFVMTAETWLGPERSRSGEEAVLAIGVSRAASNAPAGGGVEFLPPEWLGADQIDEGYFHLLPAGASAERRRNASRAPMRRTAFKVKKSKPAG